MTAEPLSNMGIVCDEHAPKPDPRYLELPLEWFLGRRAFAKLGFDSCEEAKEALGKRCPPKEHMWVEVVGRAEHESEEFRGKIANDPRFTTGECGDLVEFSRVEVEDVIAGDWKRGETAWTPMRGAWVPCVLAEDASGPGVKVRVLPSDETKTVETGELRPRFGAGSPPPRPPRPCNDEGLYSDERRTT